MEQEQVGLSSSHFPFTLERHPQHHQELGAYQPHETREREWSQRGSREYERGFPREGWPGRWETCSPVRYGREVSVKRNDSSYRELEAWAARYSHSLQRRRRIEAELRGASLGLVESSRAPERDNRGGKAALQQVVHPGLCDRAGRQQAHPSQVAFTDTGHPPKEKTCFQRRLYNQPPGYIAPPPYDTPQKSPSVPQQGDTTWAQEGKNQTSWSHPILKKQDMTVDHRARKTERFTKPDANPHAFCSQHGRPETDSLQGGSAGYAQRPHVQFEGMMSLHQSPILHTVHSKAEEPSAKIIEGRKFKLNKKEGGMTIFCLVSRIADATEIPSLPVCGLQTNLRDTVGGKAKGLSGSGTRQGQKLADEVDYRVPTFQEQSEPSNTGDLNKQKEPAACAKKSDVEEEEAKDADSTAGIQAAESGKPASVKYPLWREPSFPVGSEHLSSSTCLKEKSEEDESGVLEDKGVPAEVHPQSEARTEDVEEESEGAKGSLTADATCVVVKMEQIPSPKKQHVHFFDTAPHLEQGEDIQSTLSQENVQSDSQPNGGRKTEENTKLELLLDTEKPDTEPGSDIVDEVKPEPRTISDPCASSSVSDRETLAERAERILGIPLNESITEQQPEDAESLKNKTDESFTAEVKESEASAEDNTEEQSQNQLELDQTTSLPEIDEAKKQADVKGGQDSPVRPETPIRASEEDDGRKIEADSDENANEQGDNESTIVEDNTSPPESWPSPSPDCQRPDILLPPVPSSPNPAPILENPESIRDDLELTAPISAPANVSSAQTPSQRSASPHPQDPQSTTTCELDNQTQPVSDVLDPAEDGKTSQMTNGENSEEIEHVPVDETEELQQDEVRELAEVNGEREPDRDDEPQVEEGGVLPDSGVEETETPAEVSQNLFQDEDSVCTPGSPRTEEQLSEDTEEENTEQIQPLEESKKDIIHAVSQSLQPAGMFTDDMEPLKEVETGLFDQKTSHQNNHQTLQSQEINILQLCDTEDASIHKEISDEPSEGAAGDPEQEMGNEFSSEARVDTENQQELNPSDSSPDVAMLPPSELPAPSHGSDKDIASTVTKDPSPDAADAVTIETDVSPLYQAPCEESQKLSSSSESLPVLITSSSPPPLQEGNESVPSDPTLSEEPQYPKSLWDAVNRIRKHTAPDSENEEEEVSEMWDPENVGEDFGGLHGAQDTGAEKKEAPADESVKDDEAKQTQQEAGDVEDGRLSDAEVDDGDPPSETGTEFGTLVGEEVEMGEQSCVAEDKEEDQGHQ